MSWQTFPERPTGELAERLRNIKYVFSDADGTMLTGAKATVRSDGTPSAELVQVLVELQQAGVQVVPTSGRNRSMLFEDARILGLPGWIAEMGGLLCTRQSSQPEWCYFTGEMEYDPASVRTPHDWICETGVIDEILEHWPGDIETYHDNYVGFEYREVTVAMRGRVPDDEIQQVLDSFPLPLYVADNGYVSKMNGSTTMVDVDMDHPQDVHTYHIMPRGLTKGTGIAEYMRLKGWNRDEVLGAGDSPADCEIAEACGLFLFMSNGLSHPMAEVELARYDNAVVSRLPSTDGWVEAMRALLTCKE